MDWPEGKGMSLEKEATRAEEAPLYNKLPANEKQCTLFAEGSYHGKASKVQGGCMGSYTMSC